MELPHPYQMTEGSSIEESTPLSTGHSLNYEPNDVYSSEVGYRQSFYPPPPHGGGGGSVIELSSENLSGNAPGLHQFYQSKITPIPPQQPCVGFSGMLEGGVAGGTTPPGPIASQQPPYPPLQSHQQQQPTPQSLIPPQGGSIAMSNVEYTPSMSLAAPSNSLIPSQTMNSTIPSSTNSGGGGCINGGGVGSSLEVMHTTGGGGGYNLPLLHPLPENRMVKISSSAQLLHLDGLPASRGCGGANNSSNVMLNGHDSRVGGGGGSTLGSSQHLGTPPEDFMMRGDDLSDLGGEAFSTRPTASFNDSVKGEKSGGLVHVGGTNSNTVMGGATGCTPLPQPPPSASMGIPPSSTLPPLGSNEVSTHTPGGGGFVPSFFPQFGSLHSMLQSTASQEGGAHLPPCTPTATTVQASGYSTPQQAPQHHNAGGTPPQQPGVVVPPPPPPPHPSPHPSLLVPSSHRYSPKVRQLASAVATVAAAAQKPSLDIGSPYVSQNVVPTASSGGVGNGGVVGQMPIPSPPPPPPPPSPATVSTASNHSVGGGSSSTHSSAMYMEFEGGGCGEGDARGLLKSQATSSATPGMLKMVVPECVPMSGMNSTNLHSSGSTLSGNNDSTHTPNSISFPPVGYSLNLGGGGGGVCTANDALKPSSNPISKGGGCAVPPDLAALPGTTTTMEADERHVLGGGGPGISQQLPSPPSFSSKTTMSSHFCADRSSVDGGGIVSGGLDEMSSCVSGLHKAVLNSFVGNKSLFISEDLHAHTEKEVEMQMIPQQNPPKSFISRRETCDVDESSQFPTTDLYSAMSSGYSIGSEFGNWEHLKHDSSHAASDDDYMNRLKDVAQRIRKALNVSEPSESDIIRLLQQVNISACQDLHTRNVSQSISPTALDETTSISSSVTFTDAELMSGTQQPLTNTHAFAASAGVGTGIYQHTATTYYNTPASPSFAEPSSAPSTANSNISLSVPPNLSAPVLSMMQHAQGLPPPHQPSDPLQQLAGGQSLVAQHQHTITNPLCHQPSNPPQTTDYPHPPPPSLSSFKGGGIETTISTNSSIPTNQSPLEAEEDGGGQASGGSNSNLSPPPPPPNPPSSGSSSTALHNPNPSNLLLYSTTPWGTPSAQVAATNPPNAAHTQMSNFFDMLKTATAGAGSGGVDEDGGSSAYAHGARIAELVKQLNMLQREKTELQGEFSELKKEKESLEDQQHTLRRQCEESIAQATYLREQLVQKDGEYVKLQRLMQDVEKENKALFLGKLEAEQNNESLRKELDSQHGFEMVYCVRRIQELESVIRGQSGQFAIAGSEWNKQLVEMKDKCNYSIEQIKLEKEKIEEASLNEILRLRLTIKEILASFARQSTGKAFIPSSYNSSVNDQITSSSAVSMCSSNFNSSVLAYSASSSNDAIGSLPSSSVSVSSFPPFQMPQLGGISQPAASTSSGGYEIFGGVGDLASKASKDESPLELYERRRLARDRELLHDQSSLHEDTHAQGEGLSFSKTASSAGSENAMRLSSRFAPFFEKGASQLDFTVQTALEFENDKLRKIALSDQLRIFSLQKMVEKANQRFNSKVRFVRRSIIRCMELINCSFKMGNRKAYHPAYSNSNFFEENTEMFDRWRSKNDENPPKGGLNMMGGGGFNTLEAAALAASSPSPKSNGISSLLPDEKLGAFGQSSSVSGGYGDCVYVSENLLKKGENSAVSSSQAVALNDEKDDDFLYIPTMYMQSVRSLLGDGLQATDWMDTSGFVEDSNNEKKKRANPRRSNSCPPVCRGGVCMEKGDEHKFDIEGIIKAQKDRSQKLMKQFDELHVGVTKLAKKVELDLRYVIQSLHEGIHDDLHVKSVNAGESSSEVLAGISSNSSLQAAALAVPNALSPSVSLQSASAHTAAVAPSGSVAASSTASSVAAAHTYNPTGSTSESLKILGEPAVLEGWSLTQKDAALKQTLFQSVNCVLKDFLSLLHLFKLIFDKGFEICKEVSVSVPISLYSEKCAQASLLSKRELRYCLHISLLKDQLGACLTSKTPTPHTGQNEQERAPVQYTHASKAEIKWRSEATAEISRLIKLFKDFKGKMSWFTCQHHRMMKLTDAFSTFTDFLVRRMSYSSSPLAQQGGGGGLSASCSTSSLGSIVSGNGGGVSSLLEDVNVLIRGGNAALEEIRNGGMGGMCGGGGGSNVSPYVGMQTLSDGGEPFFSVNAEFVKQLNSFLEAARVCLMDKSRVSQGEDTLQDESVKLIEEGNKVIELESDFVLHLQYWMIDLKLKEHELVPLDTLSGSSSSSTTIPHTTTTPHHPLTSENILGDSFFSTTLSPSPFCYDRGIHHSNSLLSNLHLPVYSAPHAVTSGSSPFASCRYPPSVSSTPSIHLRTPIGLTHQAEDDPSAAAAFQPGQDKHRRRRIRGGTKKKKDKMLLGGKTERFNINGLSEIEVGVGGGGSIGSL